MNRAVIIPFHRYQPHIGEGYRVFFDYFLKNLPIWASEFDKLYVVDSDMEFDQDDLRALQKIKPETVILKIQDKGTWIPHKEIIPLIVEENMLFLDHDVVINKAGIVDSWFKAAEDGAEIVTSFDGSGGMRDLIHKKFYFMKKNNFTRMGSYYFLLTKNLLSKIDKIDFDPIYYQEPTYIPELDYTTKKGDWLDSFGYFTLKVLALDPKIHIIEDDRSSIYLMEGYKIVKDPEIAKNLGYYHIRNGNLANYILSSKLNGDMRQYNEGLTNNPRELLRSFAWFFHMADYDGDPLIETLRDMNVKYRAFLEYYEQFEKYHGLNI